MKAPLGTNKICVVILCTIDPWHYFHNLMSIGEAVDGVSEDNMMVAIGTVTEAAREETRVAVGNEAPDLTSRVQVSVFAYRIVD